MSKGCFKGVSRQFQRRFKEVFEKGASVFQENLIKSFKCVSRMFQQSFIYSKFVVAWTSLQVPEQKEGLFSIKLTNKIRQTNSTKQNLEKTNLQKFKINSNPCLG